MSAALTGTAGNSQVHSKLGALGKRSSMFPALSRFFSNMSPLVKNKHVFAVELFPAVTANISPCSHVNLPVLSKVWPLSKRLPTPATLIRLFSRIGLLVLNEFRDATEDFPTFPALVVTV